MDQECVICLDHLEEEHTIRLMCDHEIHTDCLKQLLTENEMCLCPICRKFIGTRTICYTQQDPFLNSYKVRVFIVCSYFCLVFCSFVYIQYLYYTHQVLND